LFENGYLTSNFSFGCGSSGDGSNEKSAVSQASKLAQQLLSKTQVFNAVHRPVCSTLYHHARFPVSDDFYFPFSFFTIQLRDTLMQFSSFCDALVPPPSM
jgi:hypothetical protein